MYNAYRSMEAAQACVGNIFSGCGAFELGEMNLPIDIRRVEQNIIRAKYRGNCDRYLK